LTIRGNTIGIRIKINIIRHPLNTKRLLARIGPRILIFFARNENAYAIYIIAICACERTAVIILNHLILKKWLGNIIDSVKNINPNFNLSDSKYKT
jgi:hypothetical protein